MRKTVFRFWATGCILAFSTLSVSQGETWDLEFMPEIPNASEANGKEYPPAKIFRGHGQSWSSQHQNSNEKSFKPQNDPRRLKDFYNIVTKEPTYISKQPYRGVIRLGDQRFAFVFDRIPTEEEKSEKENTTGDTKEKNVELEKQKAKIIRELFNRLYLDCNGNGDLTDDKPIASESHKAYPPNYAISFFTAVLDFEQGGKKIKIPCHLEDQLQLWSNTTTTPDGKEKTIEYKDFIFSFHTTCFREGEIKFGDKKFRVILIDFNSNGIFNNSPWSNGIGRYRGRTVVKQNYVYPGDLLYIFPADIPHPQFAHPTQPGGANEANAFCIGSVIGPLEGKFWNLEVTPQGDKLTLTPFTEELGYIDNQGKQFTLQAFNKEKRTCMFAISDKSGRASLPPGKWLLTAYSMTFEGGENQEAKANQPNEATLFARLTDSDEVNIEIAKNETTKLNFGTPLTMTLYSSVHEGEDATLTANLELNLIGAWDETCFDVRFDGERPPKPTFSITTKEGKEVESGAFEYG